MLPIRPRNLKTVGILGTRTVTESGLYGGITFARIVTPRGTALDQVHEAYVSMATAGHVTETQRDIFLSTGEYLCEACGAEGLYLAVRIRFSPSPDRSAAFSWSTVPWLISRHCFGGPLRALTSIID